MPKMAFSSSRRSSIFCMSLRALASAFSATSSGYLAIIASQMAMVLYADWHMSTSALRVSSASWVSMNTMLLSTTPAAL